MFSLKNKYYVNIIITDFASVCDHGFRCYFYLVLFLLIFSLNWKLASLKKISMPFMLSIFSAMPSTCIEFEIIWNAMVKPEMHSLLVCKMTAAIDSHYKKRLRALPVQNFDRKLVWNEKNTRKTKKQDIRFRKNQSLTLRPASIAIKYKNYH